MLNTEPKASRRKEIRKQQNAIKLKNRRKSMKSKVNSLKQN